MCLFENQKHNGVYYNTRTIDKNTTKEKTRTYSDPSMHCAHLPSFPFYFSPSLLLVSPSLKSLQPVSSSFHLASFFASAIKHALCTAHRIQKHLTLSLNPHSHSRMLRLLRNAEIALHRNCSEFVTGMALRLEFERRNQRLITP